MPSRSNNLYKGIITTFYSFHIQLLSNVIRTNYTDIKECLIVIG